MTCGNTCDFIPMTTLLDTYERATHGVFVHSTPQIFGQLSESTTLRLNNSPNKQLSESTTFVQLLAGVQSRQDLGGSQPPKFLYFLKSFDFLPPPFRTVAILAPQDENFQEYYHMSERHIPSGHLITFRRHLAIDIGPDGAIWGAPVGIRRQGGVKRSPDYTPEVAII